MFIRQFLKVGRNVNENIIRAMPAPIKAIVIEKEGSVDITSNYPPNNHLILFMIMGFIMTENKKNVSIPIEILPIMEINPLMRIGYSSRGKMKITARIAIGILTINSGE